MKLEKLLKDVEVVNYVGDLNIDISNLSHSDNDIQPGGIFFAIKGTKVDGNNFIDKAIKNGAVCIVSEVDHANLNGTTLVVVKNVRLTMSAISKRFYNNVCDKLNFISVVGTNGKTTTVNIIGQILKNAGEKVAVIGTNGVQFENFSVDTNFTTPDPILLHHIIKQLYNLGAKYIVMEVSAHAIDQHKMFGIKNEVVVFTNISNEHLDYFKTMEAYSSTKISYFNNTNTAKAVVNIDDAYGLKIVNDSGLPCFTYGIKNPSSTFAIDITMSINKMTFVVNALDNIFEVSTKLIGLYNVYNIMAAINTCILLSVDIDKIISGCNSLSEIAGRFNLINLDCNNKIVIDFAHTPESFESVLKLIKKLRHGKIITLFGCVEYADSVKRAEMGAIANKYSDIVVLTADNPNFTSVKDINKDIIKGIPVSDLKKIKEVDSRELAIEVAFEMLMEDDTLVLLGKGVENFNKINGVKIPYSEKAVVEKVIEKRFNVVKSKNTTKTTT